MEDYKVGPYDPYKWSCFTPINGLINQWVSLRLYFTPKSIYFTLLHYWWFWGPPCRVSEKPFRYIAHTGWAALGEKNPTEDMTFLAAKKLGRFLKAKKKWWWSDKRQFQTWRFHICFQCFIPFLAEVIQFDEHICFQVGWNHQLSFDFVWRTLILKGFFWLQRRLESLDFLVLFITDHYI